MTTPPDPTRIVRNRNNRLRGKSFERRIAKLLGGRRVPYSGAGGGLWGKFDVTVALNNGLMRDGNIHLEGPVSLDLVIECKTRQGGRKNYTILKEPLDAVTAHGVELSAKKPTIGAYVFTEKNTQASFMVLRVEDVVKILKMAKLKPVEPAYGPSPLFNPPST